MEETHDTTKSEGEEMHSTFENQSEASDFAENKQKSEEEGQIENMGLEKNKADSFEKKSAIGPQEENLKESSEFGGNPLKSSDKVQTGKTPSENRNEIQHKGDIGTNSTFRLEENLRERPVLVQNQVKPEREPEREKPQLQADMESLHGVAPMDLEYSNDKDISDNGAEKGEGEGEREGEVEGQISNFNFDYWSDGDDSGTEEEQSAFMKELENFHKENNLEFKPPKFYGEGLNLLKLWRQTTRLGCYEKVTSQKLWRQVGESFNPPKTCTTVSWTFRGFYEKALLEYEKHKIRTGQLEAAMPELPIPAAGNEGASGSGRARRDAAARAMEGWHSQRVLGNGEIADAIIKDRSALSLSKKDKYLKSCSSVKRRKPCTPDRNDNKPALVKVEKPQSDVSIVDVGEPADWVKINVKKTKDCYEVYALVPGLLREEVQVKSDPSGQLILSGEPEQPDNPWGVTPFKKVITLPSCIDPHQTSAVVTLHGQLFVRAPFPATDTSNK